MSLGFEFWLINYISVFQDPGLQTDVCQGRQQSEPILQDNQLLEALIPTTYYILIYVKPKSCHNQIPISLKTYTYSPRGTGADTEISCATSMFNENIIIDQFSAVRTISWCLVKTRIWVKSLTIFLRSLVIMRTMPWAWPYRPLVKLYFNWLEEFSKTTVLFFRTKVLLS